MISYILTVLVTFAAFAGEVKHTSESLDCTSLMTPQQKLANALVSKKKSLIVLVGKEKDGANAIEFMISQLFSGPQVFSYFQFINHYQQDVYTSENISLLLMPIVERVGQVDITKDKPEKTFASSLGQWLSKRDPKIHQLLLLNISDLSLQQQNELVKIYDYLPAETRISIIIHTEFIDNATQKLREHGEILVVSPNANKKSQGSHTLGSTN